MGAVIFHICVIKQNFEQHLENFKLVFYYFIRLNPYYLILIFKIDGILAGFLVKRFSFFKNFIKNFFLQIEFGAAVIYDVVDGVDEFIQGFLWVYFYDTAFGCFNAVIGHIN